MSQTVPAVIKKIFLLIWLNTRYDLYHNFCHHSVKEYDLEQVLHIMTKP